MTPTKTSWVDKVGQKQLEIDKSLDALRKKYPAAPPPKLATDTGKIDLLAKLGLLREPAKKFDVPTGGSNPFRDTTTAGGDTNPFRSGALLEGVSRSDVPDRASEGLIKGFAESAPTPLERQNRMVKFGLKETPPAEVPLSRMPFSRQLEPLGEKTPFKQLGQVGDVIQGAVESPAGQTATAIVGTGLLAYGAYQTLDAAYSGLTNYATRLAFQKMAASRGGKLTPEQVKVAQNWASQFTRNSILKADANTLFKRTPKGYEPTDYAVKVADETATKAIAEWKPTLAPTFTKTNTAVPGQTISFAEQQAGIVNQMKPVTPESGLEQQILQRAREGSLAPISDVINTPEGKKALARLIRQGKIIKQATPVYTGPGNRYQYLSADTEYSFRGMSGYEPFKAEGVSKYPATQAGAEARATAEGISISEASRLNAEDALKAPVTKSETVGEVTPSSPTVPVVEGKSPVEMTSAEFDKAYPTVKSLPVAKQRALLKIINETNLEETGVDEPLSLAEFKKDFADVNFNLDTGEVFSNSHKDMVLEAYKYGVDIPENVKAEYPAEIKKIDTQRARAQALSDKRKAARAGTKPPPATPKPIPAVTATSQAQKVDTGEGIAEQPAQVEAGETPPPAEAMSSDQEVLRQLGELQKMADPWKSKVETMEATRVALAKYVRENLPTTVRGKFVTAVARVKTDAQLQVQLARVAEVAEANAQKVLKAEIVKALARTVAKKQGAILKSRYTPKVQKFLDTIRQNLHKDRAEILAKIAENMAAIDAGAVNSAELAHQNELLSLTGIDGMGSTQLAEVLDFIKTEKTIGLAERLQQYNEAKTAKEAEHLLILREITGVSRGGAGGESGIIPGRESNAFEAQAKKDPSLLNFVNANRNMDTLFQLVTSKSGVPWAKAALSKFYNKTIFTPYHNEEIMRMGDFTRKSDSLKEILKVANDGELNKKLHQMANDKINLGTFKTTDGVEHEFEFTTNEMIAFHNWFQDSGLDKTFSDGMKWTPEIKTAITDALTADDKAVADWLIKDYEEYWQRANPIYRARYGVDLPRHPKYSPRSRDFLSDVEEVNLIFQEMHDYGQKLPSAIKARVVNTLTLKPTDALKAHDQHIVTMDAWIARSQASNELRGLIGDKNFRLAVEQNWGKNVLAEIDHDAQVIVDSVDKTAKVYRLLDTVRGNFSTAVLANPKQLLNQIPTFLYGLTEMSPMTMANGLRSFWANPLAKVHEMMTEHPYMIVRYQAGNIERDMKTALSQHPSLLSPLPTKARSILFTPMMLGDKFGTMQAYWAKYQEGLANGLSIEEAKTEAGRMSDRVQNTGAVYTLTSLQNAGSIWKMITAYQSQPNKMFQILDNNIRNLRYHRGNQAQAWLAIIMVTLVMTALFQFTQDAFKITKRQLTAWNPANNILVFGQMAQYIESLLVGDNFQYQVAPAESLIKGTGYSVSKALTIAKKINDPNKQPTPADWISLAELTGKPLGEVTGLPFPYIIQAEQAVQDKDIRGLIFSRFALKDNKQPSKSTPAPTPNKSSVPPRRKLSDLAPQGTAPSRSQSGGTRVPPRRKLSDLAPRGVR